MNKAVLVLAACLCGASLPAWSGLAEGVLAYDKDDFATALREFRPLAEKGNAVAQQKLAWMYSTGNGVAKDDSMAFKYYLLAAKSGNVVAQGGLGGMYATGEGVKKDFQEAAKWFRRAAVKGDLNSQYNLGVLYNAGGEGLAQDVKESAKWFRLAAERGYSDAQEKLGQMYGNGEGVAQDQRESVKWFRLAAEQGHADAQNNLGIMFSLGAHVRQDLVVAYALSLVAEQSSVEKGKSGLDGLADDLEPAQKEAAADLAREMGKSRNLLNALDQYVKRSEDAMVVLTKKQASRYAISNDGQEVTDSETELIWRRCPEGMTFVKNTCQGTPRTFTHEEAEQHAAAEAKRSGKNWKLPPLLGGLMTIRDPGFSPPFNPSVFPATPRGMFWTIDGFILDKQMSEAFHFYDVRFSESHGASKNSEKYFVRLYRLVP